MNREKIIRAWKDQEYRQSLGELERQLLPANPAGIIEIPETKMDDVAGMTMFVCTSGPICTEWFFSIAVGGTCRNQTTGCCGDLDAG